MKHVFLVAAIAFFTSSISALSSKSIAQGIDKSFERSYVTLQEKIKTLQQKGEKLNKDTQKELDSLMQQMNHEHAQLKHELDLKNQELNQQLEKNRRVIEEDWAQRIQRAVTEVSAGFKRAWSQLNTDQTAEKK